MEIPETRYARTADGVSIAYQVVETLSAHDERAKVEIARHHRTHVNTTGDLLLATFDGQARAVRCKDLTAGSGLTVEDAGERELKGVPDRWHLYRVVGS